MERDSLCVNFGGGVGGGGGGGYCGHLDVDDVGHQLHRTTGKYTGGAECGGSVPPNCVVCGLSAPRTVHDGKNDIQ